MHASLFRHGICASMGVIFFFKCVFESVKLYELRMLTGEERLVYKTTMVLMCTCGVSVFLGERRGQTA